MSDPENHTLRLLMKLRGDIAQVRTELVGAIESLEAKVGERSRAVDKRLDTVGHLAYAESILSRYAVADIEGRVMRIEDYLKLREDAGAPL
jgi:hypothetical protein